MALQLWLPLIGNLKNQGISNSIAKNSGATVNTNGKIGSCYTFDGTDDRIYTKLALENNILSVSIWAKVTSFGTDTQYLVGCNKGNDGFSGMQYAITISSTGVYWVIGGTSYTTSKTISTNTWYHLAMASDGTNCNFYINGENAGSCSVGTVVGYNVCLGARSANESGAGTSATYYCACSLNDFRVYDHCLSLKEIKELSKGLIIHYKLDNHGFGNPNHLLNSNKLTGLSGSYVDTDGSTVGYVKSNGTSWSEKYVATDLSADGNPLNGKEITISLDYKTDDVTYSAYHYFGWGTFVNENSTRVSDSNFAITAYASQCGKTLVSDKWIHLSYTFTVPTSWTSDTAKHYCLQIKIQGASAGSSTMYYKNIKVELGNKATKWCPNINDVSISDSIEKDVSGYDGNCTMTDIEYDYDSPRHICSTSFSSSTSTGLISKPFNTGYTSTGFTTAIWVKMNGVNTSTSPNIISLGENSFWRFRIVGNTTNNVWYYIRIGSTQCSATFTATNITLTDNKWHHHALVFDNGIVKFYIDGTLIGTTDHSSTATYITDGSTDNTWHIAGYTATSEKFIGSLSDLRVYVTALSADDVKSLYNIPISLDKTGKLYCCDIVEE